MKELTVSEALKLMKSQAEPAISLYVGTNVSDADAVGKIRSRLHRLYKTVEAVVARSHDARKRERLLVPLQRALAALRLTRSRGGIAIYHTESFTGIVRLPTAVSDLAVAADSFHLKPVLRAVQLRRTYFVLAFGKKYADLVQVTADGIHRVERFEVRVKDHRSTSEETASRRFFKDGLKVRRRKDLKFAMATLDQQLQGYLQGQRAPLLLAGPEGRQEAFRAACTYQQLLARGMNGNVEALDVQTLGQLSATFMEPFFSEFDLLALASFQKAQASGHGSTNLRDIALAAARGQVSSLLIAEDRQIWGNLDRETGAVRILEQSGEAPADDLLDDLAELVIAKGGKVTVLPSSELPSRTPIAAVLRWADNFPRVSQHLSVVNSRRGSPEVVRGVSA